MRAYETVKAIGHAANSHLAITPCSDRKVAQRPTVLPLLRPGCHDAQ
ncbi:hypothetical protein [Rubrivivax gelatinosus]|uniref:Uncharacterized protein n=1 Tax=Rubrivivax gelatinosus TaxID=28068 RepID=A0A4R2MG95_RUBGE|nr:hypothetical protein [Rubrivivax gelatinosus]TCP03574.1 hypothetical protein EV684_104297 [Rubrivivax gelatinosus]